MAVGRPWLLEDRGHWMTVAIGRPWLLEDRGYWKTVAIFGRLMAGDPPNVAENAAGVHLSIISRPWH